MGTKRPQFAPTDREKPDPSPPPPPRKPDVTVEVAGVSFRLDEADYIRVRRDDVTIEITREDKQPRINGFGKATE